MLSVAYSWKAPELYNDCDGVKEFVSELKAASFMVFRGFQAHERFGVIVIRTTRLELESCT